VGVLDDPGEVLEIRPGGDDEGVDAGPLGQPAGPVEAGGDLVGEGGSHVGEPRWLRLVSTHPPYDTD
jgi:hypothetical protein